MAQERQGRDLRSIDAMTKPTDLGAKVLSGTKMRVFFIGLTRVKNLGKENLRLRKQNRKQLNHCKPTGKET